MATQLGTVARAYIIYICIYIAILSFLRASRSHQRYSNKTRISFHVNQLEILLPAKIIPYQRAKRSIISKSYILCEILGGTQFHADNTRMK